MMNLLTIVLMTLPGLTSSFAQTMPWQDLSSQVQATKFPLPDEQGGDYVCCNQPPTAPTQGLRFRDKLRRLAPLTKRDDRHAPVNWVFYKRMVPQQQQPEALKHDSAYNIPADIPRTGSQRQSRLTHLVSSLMSLLKTRPEYGNPRAGADYSLGKRGEFGELGGPPGNRR